MRSRKPTPERLGAFSDGVFAVIITIMVLELKPPAEPSFFGAFAAVADWPQLCSELFVHCDRLGEPSSSAAVCGACNATTDLVELRALVLGLAGAVFDHMGCGNALRSGFSICVCRCICSGECSISRVRLGGAGSGGSARDGFGTDAADESRPVLRDISDVRCGQCRGAELSAMGLCADMLRPLCLSATGGAWSAPINMRNVRNQSRKENRT